jgi:hypothetical protein
MTKNTIKTPRKVIGFARNLILTKGCVLFPGMNKSIILAIL